MNMIFSIKKNGGIYIPPKQTQNVSEIQRNITISKTNTKSLNINVNKTSLRSGGGFNYDMIRFVESGAKSCGYCSGAR